MTPIELSNLYQTLRTRVSIHSPKGCAEISLPLPANFSDELAFYRLVIWGYALVNEAAKIPLAFLTNLPPLKADSSLRNEMSTLRTYVAHNLDIRRNGIRKRMPSFIVGSRRRAGEARQTVPLTTAIAASILPADFKRHSMAQLKHATYLMTQRMAQGSSPTLKGALTSLGKRIGSIR